MFFSHSPPMAIPMRSLIISLFVCIYASTKCCANDSILVDNGEITHVESKKTGWTRFVPRQFVVQNAGNMGAISVGAGWDYGKGRWETHFLVGLVPKDMSNSARMTLTLKQNYLPWKWSIGKGIMVEPLSLGVYLNSILGSEFWNHQPSRYPNNYYWFSTRFRTNVCAGQRMTISADCLKIKIIKSISVFYEISSCDLYINDYINNDCISFWDVASLSLGLKLQLR